MCWTSPLDHVSPNCSRVMTWISSKAIIDDRMSQSFPSCKGGNVIDIYARGREQFWLESFHRVAQIVDHPWSDSLTRKMKPQPFLGLRALAMIFANPPGLLLSEFSIWVWEIPNKPGLQTMDYDCYVANHIPSFLKMVAFEGQPESEWRFWGDLCAIYVI